MPLHSLPWRCPFTSDLGIHHGGHFPMRRKEVCSFRRRGPVTSHAFCPTRGKDPSLFHAQEDIAHRVTLRLKSQLQPPGGSLHPYHCRWPLRIPRKTAPPIRTPEYPPPQVPELPPSRTIPFQNILLQNSRTSIRTPEHPFLEYSILKLLSALSTISITPFLVPRNMFLESIPELHSTP